METQVKTYPRKPKMNKNYIIIILLYSVIFSYFCSENNMSLDYSHLIKRYHLNSSMPDWGVYLLLDWLIYIGNIIGLESRNFYRISIAFILTIFLLNLLREIGTKEFTLFIFLFTILVSPNDFVHLLKQNFSALLFLTFLFSKARLKVMYLLGAILFHWYISFFILVTLLAKKFFFRKSLHLKAVGCFIAGLLFWSIDSLNVIFYLLSFLEIPVLSSRVAEYSVDRWDNVNFSKVLLLCVTFLILYLIQQISFDKGYLKVIFLYCLLVSVFAFLFSGLDILVYRVLVYAKIPALVGLSVVLRPGAWRF